MTHQNITLDDEERRQFLKVLGVTGTATVAGEFTLDEVRRALGSGSSDELAAMGESIRGDLGGQLDASLLAGGLDGIAAGIERLPELRAAGIPAQDSSAYHEVAAPGWRVYDHLGDIDFFAVVERHLPSFTAAHVAETAKELIRSDPLTASLSDLGFSEREKAALVMGIVNGNDRLALWVPTKDIPAGVEFDVGKVAPLHQRAAGGVLLWIDDLDQHLWQKEVLMTDAILDDAIRHTKTMLGGFHLLGTAAHDIAGEEALTDSQLTAALTAGAAAMILGQEDLTDDVFRITDEMRAPMEGAR